MGRGEEEVRSRESWLYEGEHARKPASATEKRRATRKQPAVTARIAAARRAESSEYEADPTLQHPRCVFQILKRHFSRYTPELVEQSLPAFRRSCS